MGSDHTVLFEKMELFQTMGFTLLTLTSCLYLCQADVGDFSPCLQFFYRSWPPKGLQGTPICQRYGNIYHFATLYSRPRRSPWFSSYMYTQPEGKRPLAEWKFEPQLANSKEDGNMIPFPPGPLDQNVVESQAVQPDYINSSYTRGHLNPSLHHRDHEDRSATFTLTNTVPQTKGSNSGPWEELEQHVHHALSSYCLGQAFIVTGIIPYQKEDHWLRGHRVAVPEYLWSAYCCLNFSKSLPGNLTESFPTYAAIGRNDPNSTEEIVPVDRGAHVHKGYLGYDVRSMPLDTLEMYLKERFGTVVSVFYEKCLGLE